LFAVIGAEAAGITADVVAAEDPGRDGGGAGWLEMRPAEVSSPAGAIDPTACADATSAMGAFKSPAPVNFLFGAFGAPIFKFEIVGRRDDVGSESLPAVSFFSSLAFRESSPEPVRKSEFAAPVTTAGTAETAERDCSTTGCA
jgi:hypothetical protein